MLEEGSVVHEGVERILARKPRDVYRRIRNGAWDSGGRRLLLARSPPFVVAEVADFTLDAAGSVQCPRIPGERAKEKNPYQR